MLKKLIIFLYNRYAHKEVTERDLEQKIAVAEELLQSLDEILGSVMKTIDEHNEHIGVKQELVDKLNAKGQKARELIQTLEGFVATAKAL